MANDGIRKAWNLGTRTMRIAELLLLVVVVVVVLYYYYHLGDRKLPCDVMTFGSFPIR